MFSDYYLKSKFHVLQLNPLKSIPSKHRTRHFNLLSHKLKRFFGNVYIAAEICDSYLYKSAKERNRILLTISLPC